VLFAELSKPEAVKVSGMLDETVEVGEEVGVVVAVEAAVAAGVEVAESVGAGVETADGVGVTTGFEAGLTVLDKSMYAAIEITRIMIIPIVK